LEHLCQDGRNFGRKVHDPTILDLPLSFLIGYLMVKS
jgi:hypothetical protein